MSSITFSPLSANLVTNGGAAVTFDVTNDSTETLTLSWIDQNGKVTAYQTIVPGQEVQQPSYTGAAWEVTSADKAVGFEFLPSVPGDIIVGSNNQPTFDSFAEKIVTTTAGQNWSTEQGYGVINCARSLGVTDYGSTLPVNGETHNLSLNLISASSAWKAGYTGAGVTVAVIDVGVAVNPELPNIVGNYNVLDGTSNAAPTPGAYQDHPLGVASIIAGNPVSGQTGPSAMGVAPGASILNVKVGDTTGSSDQNIATGIDYAVDHGAKVLCIPLENTATTVSQVLVNAIDYAYQHNVVAVVIGGNFSNYGPTGPALIAQVANECIDVGNYNIETGQAFSTSNTPGTTTPFNWVEASSTGYVPNASGGFTFYEDGGTSFAGPSVAGLAALLFQQNPNATATQIMNEIIDGCSIDGLPSYDETHTPVVSATNTMHPHRIMHDCISLVGVTDTTLSAVRF